MSMTDELVICFYNRFSYDIGRIKTVQQKIRVLSEMQEVFQEAVRNKSSIRNELSEVYQQLKIECEKMA
ncbi:MAG: hypothetical protein NC489_45960 [Ruminococcus flavefaciens]|nr:hypothetical protein [Ruminococcus flavefaciens]